MPTWPSEADEPIDLARRVLETEAQAILGLIPQLDASFDRALDLLQRCTGRVIVTGMGKSGHHRAQDLRRRSRARARRRSSSTPPKRCTATSASSRPTTSSSRCRTAARPKSWSGCSKPIRRIGARLISLTGHPQSTLGQASDVTLELPRRGRSLPDEPGADGQHDGDAGAGRRAGAGAVAAQGLRRRALRRPAPGRTARQAADARRGADAAPATPCREVAADTPMPDVIHEMSSKRLGMTCVVDDRRPAARASSPTATCGGT